MIIPSRHFLFLYTTLAAFAFISCTNYGEKVSKDSVEIFYKDNVTKQQAQETLDLLYPSWNEPGNKKSVQLVKKADTVYFRMVIDKEKAKGIEDETFLLLANGISSAIFNDTPVNVDLTDNNFNTLRTLHFKKIDTGDQSKVTAGNIEVYIGDGLGEEQANLLAMLLDSIDGDSNVTKSFKLGKDTQGEYQVSMVSIPERTSEIPAKEYFDLAALLSDSVFNGAVVNLQLTDQNFKPYQSFRHPK